VRITGEVLHVRETEALVRYLIAQSPLGLVKTQVVKLLYLVDVAAASVEERPITGLEWIRYRHGPWSRQIDGVLDRLAERGEIRRVRRYRIRDSAASELFHAPRRLGRAAPPQPSGLARRLADFVWERYGALPLEDLLERVSATPPMQPPPELEGSLDLSRLSPVADEADNEDRAWLMSGLPWGADD